MRRTIISGMEFVERIRRMFSLLCFFVFVSMLFLLVPRAMCSEEDQLISHTFAAISESTPCLVIIDSLDQLS
jgi:hypothetical protein